jgi:serine/threonine-protein kinase
MSTKSVELHNRMVAQIGDTIGTYRLIESVGSGGMATVYKARQEKLGRDVAIKIMHAGFAGDDSFLARFEREAKIVANLDHPNIVPIFDYDDFEGQPFLAMKFIEGITLKEVLQKGLLQIDDILAVMKPVADALTYAHEQGVLHRDVKPSNIIIGKRGHPYLTDFGLARLVQQGESTMSVDVMLGTPHYISPGQAQGEIELDARTDIYSMGVILYEMTAGRTPFSGETSYAIIHNHIYTPPPSPRKIDPEIPQALEDVLLKALAKNPNDRYKTPLALINDYEKAAQGQSVNVQPPKRKPAVPPPPPIPTPAPPALKDSGEVIDDIRAAGEEIKQAFKTIGKAIKSEIQDSRGSRHEMRRQRRESRYRWRPGAGWTKDIHGNEGFYTKAELEAMEKDVDPETLIRRRVEKRMEERREFYSHITAYVMVNLMLWVIWAVTDFGGHPWPIYPMLVWGIGVAIHTVIFYNEHGGGRQRRDRIIQEEIERERARVYGEKAKNEDFANAPPIRLTGDGELTDSFLDELDGADKRKKR